ncbi:MULTISPECIES: hypothetical protein [unclassified Streptomyces]|uniref:hypothetical protein n=1 Tax=unclassified Streptomyces TaxID=2593676 RepID=UPI0006AE8CE7|nr:MULTISPECIES: hypothetical protein [unclassified Streptomyces]KOX23337.1 hypothetical protein ADL06_22485 [Streptomyces sp. NRRL F-6491]KOX42723.1 hypothetical protein ADL08_15245 [Streptomyces sp. NRRL F-6492]
MDDTRLRHELREAALAHRPDRARILARVERGLAAPVARPRPPAGWTGRRWAAVAAVTAAVAGAVGLAGITTTASTDRPTPPASTPTALPAPGPAARATGTVNPGSNRWWAQSDLGVTTGSPVTGLVVELRIARTAGVVSTGHWRTRPADDFTTTVTEEPGSLVYRWTLKEGRTLPPGPHVFAAQYNHSEGVRDASSDTYGITLTAPDGGLTTLRGGFAPLPPR